MDHIRTHADPNVIKYLIANKIDIEKREVSKEEGEELAAKYNMKYFEMSARTGENITETITELVNDIYKKKYGSLKENGFKVSAKSSGNAPKSKCC